MTTTLSTDSSVEPNDRPPDRDMAWIPGGTFRMGSNDFYPEERPVHDVRVDGFWMDDHPVTVAEFRRFVKATDHVTLAEKPLDPGDYPGADPTLLVPGSLVFKRTRGPVNLDDYSNWWHWVPGAQWRHPEGPGSTLDGRDRHPITHVAFEDARAYAAWAGKDLPSEAEWEFAARGGLDGAVYAWGDEFAPKGKQMATRVGRRSPATRRHGSWRPSSPRSTTTSGSCTARTTGRRRGTSRPSDRTSWRICSGCS